MKLSNEKIIFLLIIFTISILICLSALSADNTYQLDSISLNDDSETIEDMIGCCSVVMQLDNNNSVISFRRDASNVADINITEDKIGNTTLLKQFKTSAGYFVQVIVTSDGWVVGCGGRDDGDSNKEIEEIINDCLINKEISDSNLKKIHEIKKKYGIGHVIIKAPNGDYGVSTANTHYKGKLKPGDYISIPNRDSYCRKGTITSYNNNPINETIKLAQTDLFGITRRNIVSYQYQEIDNDTYKGACIDVYASNDDGHAVNRNTAGLCDNIYYNGTLHDKESIPIAPDKILLGTYLPNQTNNDSDIFFGINKYLAYLFIALLIVLFGLLANRIIKVLNIKKRHDKRRHKPKNKPKSLKRKI